MTSAWVEALAIGAPAVAALGAAGIAGRQYARQARENRIADKQADAYVMLAEHTVRVRQYSLVAFPDVGLDSPLMPPALSNEDHYRMLAHIEAYGSDPMRACLERLLVAEARTRTAVFHLQEMRAISSTAFSPGDLADRRDALQGAQATREELHTRAEETLRLLSAELQGRDAAPSTPPGRSSPRSRLPWRRSRSQEP